MTRNLVHIDAANLIVGILALVVASVTLGYVVRQDRREKMREREAMRIAKEDAEWNARYECAVSLLVRYGHVPIHNLPLHRYLGFDREQRARIEQYLIHFPANNVECAPRPLIPGQTRVTAVRQAIGDVFAAFEKFKTNKPEWAKQYGIDSNSLSNDRNANG